MLVDIKIRILTRYTDRKSSACGHKDESGQSYLHSRTVPGTYNDHRRSVTSSATISPPRQDLPNAEHVGFSSTTCVEMVYHRFYEISIVKVKNHSIDRDKIFEHLAARERQRLKCKDGATGLSEGTSPGSDGRVITRNRVSAISWRVVNDKMADLIKGIMRRSAMVTLLRVFDSHTLVDQPGRI